LSFLRSITAGPTIPKYFFSILFSSLIRCIIVYAHLIFYIFIKYTLANHLTCYNLSQAISLLTPATALRYRRREYVFVTNPVFSPFFLTIIAATYMIRQAIVCMIHRHNCDIICSANTMFMECGSNTVTTFVLY